METTVNRDNAVGTDAAIVDEVCLRTIRAGLRFARATDATTVSDDIALRRRIVLQLNTELIEPCFLIVEANRTNRIAQSEEWQRRAGLSFRGRCGRQRLLSSSVFRR